MPVHKAQAFKCASWNGEASAWCTVCEWKRFRSGTASDKNAVKRVCAQAKRHVEQTGHEVRIDHTRQRGYRVLEDFSQHGETP